MRILITGASGFVGRNLSEHLLGKNEIFAATHTDLDLLDAVAVEQYIKRHQIEVIIHCAAAGGSRKTNYDSESNNVVEQNLRMFFNLERCLTGNMRMIHMGSGAEYDRPHWRHKMQEAYFDEYIPNDSYGYAKYLISRFIEQKENIVCLRIFGLFGKYEDYRFKFISNAIVKNLLEMPIVINQNVVFDYLYIDDFVRIVEDVIENKPRFKHYNVTPTQSIDLLTAAHIINKISGFKSEIVVLTEGLNQEYSGDNTRLLGELTQFQFTGYEQAITKLFHEYARVLDELDIAAVKADPYLKACKINKGRTTPNDSYLKEGYRMAYRDDSAEKLKQQILDSAVDYYRLKHGGEKKKFAPGDRISYGGRVFDEKEITNLIDSALEFWLTTGRYANRFEDEFAKFLGVGYCSLTNSGSSANLLAFMALTSAKLGDRRIARGDEVITVAAGFPTTVAPIVQYGAIPVFVDVTLLEYNLDVAQLERALSKRTKAVMVAHTLGNPFNLQAVKDFCDKHNLWLIEDNCDALGSKYFYNGEWRYTGTIGHLGTSSFYPPHHMTMGEGGAVYTNDVQLKRLVESFRDWGRDCWCLSGKDNSCQRRFTQQFGELPYGYDHKYVYSHFGYNLKVTDMQAAIGCAQLEKLPLFIAKRRENWQMLRDALGELADRFILPEPEKNSLPSWFGFLLTVRDNAGFSRDEIVMYLEQHGIQTRMLFAGNLLKHPCFDDMRQEQQGYRVAGDLTNTDLIVNNTFWLGVYPGMSSEMLEYMVSMIRKFCCEKKNTLDR